MKIISGEWANSYLEHNRTMHCTEEYHLVKGYFKTRQDNGIVLIFCTKEEEKNHDKRFLKLAK